MYIEVMALYLNTTASGQIKGSTGKLYGFYVNSTSSGTIKLWDNTSASGAVILNTVTPAAGPHMFSEPITFQTGLFLTVGGTINVTFIYK